MWMVGNLHHTAYERPKWPASISTYSHRFSYQYTSFLGEKQCLTPKLMTKSA